MSTVGHAVHTDEGGALVTGDVVVEFLALVQEPDVKNPLHEHTAEDGGQCRGRTHQHTAGAAEQGADSIEPP